MKHRAMFTVSVAISLAMLGLAAGLLFLPPHTWIHAANTGVKLGSGMKTKEQIRNEAEVQKAFGKLPLSFEANHGQTAEQVKFLARGNGYAVYLTADAALLQLRATATQTGKNKRLAQKRSASIKMSLSGANAKAVAAGVDELPGKSNYFLGSNPQHWKTNIPTYSKVKFASVYPGVDLVYYGTAQRQLEYDFVVAPGADPKNIKLHFAGADKLEIEKDGHLKLHLAEKHVRLEKPVVYQEKDGNKQEISSRYVLTDKREIGFEIAAYDATQPLVIDPVLAYSTYLGGSGQEAGLGIAVTDHGDAYVTGLTTSLNFPTKPIGAHIGSGGSYDAYVARLNAAGSQLIYSAYLGGSEDEDWHGGVSYGGIAVDALGNAYVTGLTKSKDFPTLNPYQANLKGYADAFVTKLNSAGGLVYSTFLGGTGYDAGSSIAVDTFGNAYVTGQNESPDFPTQNAFQPAHGGGFKDAFVTKLHASGAALIYSTNLGGKEQDLGNGIAVDSFGNAYVLGWGNSKNYPTLNPYQAALNGVSDLYITRFNTIGGLTYSTYLGGSAADDGERPIGPGIAVDNDGNIYVTAQTTSADFPTTPGVFQSTMNGPSDAIIAKLKPNNPPATQLIYSTFLGGGGSDAGAGIEVDILGNAYVAGRSGGTFYTTHGLPGCPNPGAFAVKLNANASKLVWATCLSGEGKDGASDIAVDAAGSAYVTGFTTSVYFPTVNPLQANFAGGTAPQPQDAFITKIGDGLDHFKCYDVKAHQDFHPFKVTLRDQFEKQEVIVVRPSSLCNPVVKCINGDCNRVLNPDAHLVCYDTKDAEGTPEFERREVIVSNQFGQEQKLTVFRRKNQLCIPSLKAHADNR